MDRPESWQIPPLIEKEDDFVSRFVHVRLLRNRFVLLLE